MKISIQSLCKQFGAVKALSDICLDIADGELFFLLGPSGCGKTTLLRCLGGFERPSSGKILLDGEDVSSRPPNLRNTAMVFQGYALWPHLTVRENISFGLEMRGMDKKDIRQKADAVMESVQILPLAERKPNELSGGQQQRVALARTLVVHPGCLLLDEPLANLDAKLRRDMRFEIRRLCKENHLTGVYVTHDRQEALSMADRVAVLKDGRIVQVGSPRDIYCHPVNAFVASFIGETNFLEGTLLEAGSTGVSVKTPAGILRAQSAPADMKAGDAVTLSIRPEAISLNPALAGGDANRLSVTMATSAYQGEVANHNVTTDEGRLELSFFELNPKADSFPGAKADVFVAQEDVVVLPFAPNPR